GWPAAVGGRRPPRRAALGAPPADESRSPHGRAPLARVGSISGVDAAALERDPRPSPATFRAGTGATARSARRADPPSARRRSAPARAARAPRAPRPRSPPPGSPPAPARGSGARP